MQPLHALSAGLDFRLSAETISFTVGGPSEQCVDLIALEDNAVEIEELVRIGLGGVPLGSPDFVLITIGDTSRELHRQ